MKKFALLTVAAAAVLNLAACGLEHVDAPPSATPDTAEYFAVAEPGAEAAYYELPREFGRHIAAGGERLLAVPASGGQPDLPERPRPRELAGEREPARGR